MIYNSQKPNKDIGKDQESKEAACRIYGHMAEQESKPATFAEMVTMEANIVCRRCGRKIV